MEQKKEIHGQKSTSTVLKLTKENTILKEELTENKKELSYLRKFKAEISNIFRLEKVKEFFESIGLMKRIQELLQEKTWQKREEKNYEMR